MTTSKDKMYKTFLFGCGVQVEQVCCLSTLSAKHEAACEYFCFQGQQGNHVVPP